mmetsp:Transcript_42061/g.98669  ORF Transcript_42061/g.98669 Transcript_42061/m.98669 type:complete len:83 (+) Transcript_42061:65-313(+)
MVLPWVTTVMLEGKRLSFGMRSPPLHTTAWLQLLYNHVMVDRRREDERCELVKVDELIAIPVATVEQQLQIPVCHGWIAAPK